MSGHLDTKIVVETPEGIELTAELVGLVPRALAFAIDFLLRAVVLVILFFLASGVGEFGFGLFLIVWFALEWWYPVLFEYFNDGQTIGKRQMGIRTVSRNLTPLSFSAALTRNLLRAADILPLFYAVGSISIVMTRNKVRLGDLAADTIVVYAQSKNHIDLSTVKVRPIAPNFELTEQQRQMCINFCLNRGNLSLDRQNELAEIVAPYLPQRADNARDVVAGIGAWLLGLTNSVDQPTSERDRAELSR